MLKRVIISSCLTAGLLFFTAPCFAQVLHRESTKVVILAMKECCRKTAWLEAETAIADELKTIDLRIQFVQSPPIDHDNIKPTLVQIAQQHNATVVIRLFSKSKVDYRADILTIRLDGKSRLHQLYFNAEYHPDILPTATLRIVETVRAGLFYEKAYPQLEEPRTPKLDSRPPFHKIGIGTGVSGTWSPGGIHPSLGIGANMHFKPTFFLLIELDVNWEVYTQNIQREDAATTFDTVLVRGSLYWDMVAKGKVHPALGFGTGALFAWSTGRSEPSEGNISQKERVAYIGAAGRLAFDMTPHSAFVINFRSGFLLPEIKLYLREELAATHGRPLLEIFGGFEFRFL